MKIPVGTQLEIDIHQLAQVLKGHRFLVHVKVGEVSTQQVVQITGEYDSNKGTIDAVVVEER